MSLPIFWGLKLSPSKKATPEIENNIRITTVSFGQKVQKGSRSAVVLNIEGKEFVLCALTESKTESISCEVVIPGDSKPTFHVTGNNDVYLTGHIIYPEEYEDSDDSENDALAQLYGSDLSDEDDDEDFEGEDSEEEFPEGKDIDDDSEEDEDDLIIQQELQKATSKKKDNKPSKKEAPVVSKKAEQPKESRNEINQKNDGQSKPSKNEKKPELNPKGADNNNKRKNEADSNNNKKNKVDPAPAKKESIAEPKSTVKVLSSGLKIEDRVVGTGQEAKRNNRVMVRYIGRLKNGKIFDQNSSGSPFAFRLGAGEVIKGWDQGVLGMRIGGQRKLTIPAPLAYGSRGAPPDIPKNAELTFEIKLMGLK